MVVLGILATIAIPKFSAMRAKSFIATVTSDLKNMASQQEIYLSNEYTYTTSLTDLELRLSDQVSIDVNFVDGQGWAATASHTGLVGQQCRMFFGEADPADANPATAPGTVFCN